MIIDDIKVKDQMSDKKVDVKPTEKVDKKDPNSKDAEVAKKKV